MKFAETCPARPAWNVPVISRGTIMLRLATLLTFAGIAATTTSAALAGPAWEFTSASQSFNNDNWIFANSFTVVSNVTVSGLGYYADPNNGQVDNNLVALYRCDTAGCLTTATQLASATVTNAYPINGHFRYVTVPTLTLTPGDYEVSGVSVGNNYTWNDAGFHTDPSIVYNDNRWVLTGGSGNPDFINTVQNDVSDGYWGPNLFFGDAGGFTGGVPEPATWSLMIGGFGLVGGALRASRRAPAAQG
jgi:hypothetical protein